VVVAWNVNADRELMCVSLFVVLGTDSAERRTRRRLAQLRRLPWSRSGLAAGLN